MQKRASLTQKKKTTKYRNLYPVPFFYGLYRRIMKVFFRLLFCIQFHRDPALETIDEPLFVIANHVSYADPIFAMLALPKHRLRFVAGEEITQMRGLRVFARPMRLIKIKPFRINLKTTISVIKSVRAGVSVALYPEAQRSVAGDMTPFGLSTAKLIQHLGVPTAAVISHGAYLSWPRWRPIFRPGKVEVETRLLLSAEEAKTLPLDEIQDRLITALKLDDYTWQSENRRAHSYFSFKRARGLQTICHWCPSCDQPFVMATKKKTLYCTLCGQAFEVRPDGFFTATPGSKPYFDHPLEYVRWQRKRTLDALIAGDVLKSRVTLNFHSSIRSTSSADPERPRRHGTMVMRHDSLTFFEDEDALSCNDTLNDVESFDYGNSDAERWDVSVTTEENVSAITEEAEENVENREEEKALVTTHESSEIERGYKNRVSSHEVISFHLGEMPAPYCSFPRFADLRSDQHVWRVFPEKVGFVSSLAEMCRAIWMRNNGKKESDYRL